MPCPVARGGCSGCDERRANYFPVFCFSAHAPAVAFHCALEHVDTLGIQGPSLALGTT